MTFNPYEAPQAPVLTVERESPDEIVRKRHIAHEASVKSVGLLYWLGGGLVSFFSVIAMMSVFAPHSRSPELGFPIISLVLGVVNIWTGTEVRKLTKTGRRMSAVFAAIGLLAFPVGTLINIYIFYLLFSQKGTMVFSAAYKEIIAATPHIKYKTSIVIWILLALVVLFFLVVVAGGYLERTPH